MDRNKEKTTLFSERYGTDGIIGHNVGKKLTAVEAEKLILGATYVKGHPYAKPQKWENSIDCLEGCMIGASPPPERNDDE